jgi:hypothetical protein
MRMLGDDQNTDIGLPSALNGRPKGAKEASDGTPKETGTASHDERERTTRVGTAHGHRILDQTRLQPDADHTYIVRDGSPNHRPQAPTLGVFSTLTEFSVAHQSLPASKPAVVESRPRPRAATLQPDGSALTLTHHRPPYTFAGLQLLLGYAWLLAGVDKLLLGNFPAQLAQTLTGTLHGGALPGLFADFLRAIVLPNGPFFGLLVEYGETLAGLGLIAAGLAILFAPPLERRVALPAAQWIGRMRRLLIVLGALAAVGTVLLGTTYYLLDGAPFQGFMPSIAFDGALDPGLQLALGSLVLLAAGSVNYRSRRRRAQGGQQAKVRRLAAMRLEPEWWMRVITRLRTAARMYGAAPERRQERSSPKVTSRT